jgi:putative PIN family toxin of toxin-antitoxin system
MIRVVLDTNVIVSALVFGGKPAKILALAVEGHITNIISEPIIAEVTGVLRKKFSWGSAQAKSVGEWLRLFSKVVKPTERLQVISCEADNRILECAACGGAQVIVSGDKKHLLKLKKYKDIVIVDPAMFLKLIEEKEFTE